MAAPNSHAIAVAVNQFTRQINGILIWERTFHLLYQSENHGHESRRTGFWEGFRAGFEGRFIVRPDPSRLSDDQICSV